jgi:hypothetical protein
MTKNKPFEVKLTIDWDELSDKFQKFLKEKYPEYLPDNVETETHLTIGELTLSLEISE